MHARHWNSHKQLLKSNLLSHLKRKLLLMKIKLIDIKCQTSKGYNNLKKQPRNYLNRIKNYNNKLPNKLQSLKVWISHKKVRVFYSLIMVPQSINYLNEIIFRLIAIAPHRLIRIYIPDEM